MNETTELIMRQLNSKKVHAETHELGGGDEIDVTKLKNIDSYVTKTGDFSGTWNGLAMTSVEPGLSSAFNALKAEKVQYFSTVEEMKASTKLQVGSCAITSSYRYVNDGGDGTYMIVDDNTLVDDGGSVHTIANGLKAKLMFDKSFINIKQFGAIGGSGWSDDTSYIQKAIAFLNTSLADATSHFYGGGTLFFPGGVYVCKQPIVLTLNIRLLGVNTTAWDFYGGKNSASTIRFQNFSDTQKAAIKFSGYLSDGSQPSGYTITVPESDAAIVSADNVSMMDLVVESYNQSILLGINLVNGTTARFKRVAVKSFKYSILTNCSWGSSFENIFSLSSLGGIILDTANTGTSIRDSYITVTGTTIPDADVITPYVNYGTGIYPKQSFGILSNGGYISISNVNIEKPNVAIKAYDSKIDINHMNNERISTCLVESVNSTITFNTNNLWNPNSTPIPLLNAKDASVCTLINARSCGFATLVNADNTCKIVTVNCGTDLVYNNKKSTISIDDVLKNMLGSNGDIPSCRVYNNANVSIANNTTTPIPFNSERFDTDNIHDVTTNNTRLTCTVAGKYTITGNLRYAANATGSRESSIRQNGSTIIASEYTTGNPNGTSSTIMSVSTLYHLNVGDYVELCAFQTSGGALNIEFVGQYSPEFSMVKVG